MPRRLASKWLVKWPTFDASSLYVLMAFSLILGLGQFALSLVPSLGQMSSRVGALAPSFALAFALASWYLDRSNPIRIFILVFVIGLALWSGFSMGGGISMQFNLTKKNPLTFSVGLDYVRDNLNIQTNLLRTDSNGNEVAIEDEVRVRQNGIKLGIMLVYQFNADE